MTNRFKGRLSRLLLAVAGSLGIVAAAQSQQLAGVSHLAIPGGPVTAQAPATHTSGPVQLFVRLKDAPLAAVAGNKRTGLKMTGAQQRAYAAQLRQKQAAVMAQIQALGGSQLASLVNATNGLAVEIAASQAPVIAGLPGVAQVLPIGEYELDLSETVPYIGSAALQSMGVDGTGVRVGILDSGIDWTHRNLGGPGTVAAYLAAYGPLAPTPSNPAGCQQNPQNINPPVFNSKVVGGFDFVGEVWPNGPLAPDPNPIDCQGHGTNVADIAGGRSADGLHKGVAPGAQLYAIKVCSAVATSCSGVAIVQGFDYALDPNGDGDLSDALDVVNLSLGASYGQRENSSVLAANTASQFGVVVVVSAGNSADRPFITGSPSSATSAISVAQTQVPSAVSYPLEVHAPAAIAGTYKNTNTVAWAPVGNGFSNVQVKATAASPNAPPVNDGCNANPPAPGSLAGFVALIRRGTCAISEKVQNATNAGAVGVLIDNNAAGDPPTFSQGPEQGPFAPTLILTQADGNTIRGQLAAQQTVIVSTAAPLSLSASMVASSSRGPNYGIGAIKPDVGAPGAAVSAVVGSGTGQRIFGGTSGAAPMVSGVAAQLLQAFPKALPHEIKARIMNAAEINVTTNPILSDALAPITRIGGGEVRADQSYALKTAAWDASEPAAVSLSMGVHRNIGNQVLRKRVLVRNYHNTARTYSISRSFRYANDEASGAVTFSMPSSVSVPANGSTTFIVTATVRANMLPTWESTGINGGLQGGNGALLNLPEYDGYITISDAMDTVRLPWHVLPHRAHNVAAPASLALNGNPSAPLNLTNTGGAVGGRVDVFYLTGTSPQLPNSVLPGEGDSYAVIDLRAVGIRLVSIPPTAQNPQGFGVQFAINTWGQVSHPNYPRRISVFIDQDGNGTDDFEVWTQENGAFASSGQSVTFVRKLTSNSGSGFFFTDADLSSANAIMTIPMQATLAGAGPNLALTPDSTFRFRVQVSDNYFTGLITDSIPQMQVNLAEPRFFPTGFGFTAAVGATTPITVNRNADGDALSPAQTGLLLMTRDGLFGKEALTVTVTP